jgi:hypothetical protein
VAAAVVSAAEDLRGPGAMAERNGFVAGGRDHGCQMTTRDLVSVVFGLAGLPLPADRLFAADLESCYLDWYDTEETRRVLGYQNHSLRDWLTLMEKTVGRVRPFIRALKPAIMAWLERQSPLHPRNTRGPALAP